MGFFKDAPAVTSKTLAPPTLDDRLDVQQRASDAAVDLFFRAVTNLERAAEELDEIATDSQANADIHAKRAEDAAEAASANRQRANKIRNLLD